MYLKTSLKDFILDSTGDEEPIPPDGYSSWLKLTSDILSALERNQHQQTSSSTVSSLDDQNDTASQFNVSRRPTSENTSSADYDNVTHSAYQADNNEPAPPDA